LKIKITKNCRKKNTKNTKTRKKIIYKDCSLQHIRTLSNAHANCLTILFCADTQKKTFASEKIYFYKIISFLAKFYFLSLIFFRWQKKKILRDGIVLFIHDHFGQKNLSKLLFYTTC